MAYWHRNLTKKLNKMKYSTFVAAIFTISVTFASIHQVQAAGTSLINLDCQLKNGGNLAAILDGPNQQLTIDKSVFQFIKVKPEGQGEALIFQRANSEEPVIASLNISAIPIRLAIVDNEQVSQYICTYTSA
ncbi:phage protein [Yersinia aldovae]|nr:phage protein [Yersinia aldovae]